MSSSHCAHSKPIEHLATVLRLNSNLSRQFDKIGDCEDDEILPSPASGWLAHDNLDIFFGAQVGLPVAT